MINWGMNWLFSDKIQPEDLAQFINIYWIVLD